MRDGHVANEGQAVHDGRQQSQAEQCNPGGGAVVPSPAQGVEAEQLNADGDDQLGERRLGIKIVLAQQVVVGVVREVQLIEDEGRVGRDVIWLPQPGKRRVLVVMPDTPGADRRGRARVGKDIEKERAAEPQYAGDQREGDQPDNIVAVDPPPAPARSIDHAGTGSRTRGWGDTHQLAGPRSRPFISATNSSTLTMGTTTSAPAISRGPSCRSVCSTRSR